MVYLGGFFRNVGDCQKSQHVAKCHVEKRENCSSDNGCQAPDYVKSKILFCLSQYLSKHFVLFFNWWSFLFLFLLVNDGIQNFSTFFTLLLYFLLENMFFRLVILIPLLFLC
jgi:hypothetical protein